MYSNILNLVFSNWSKLDVSGTFHANFCSFLIFHELESTDISNPQQLPATGRHVYSCDSSCLFVIGQFRWTSSRTHLLGWNVWQKPKYKFVWSFWSHTFPHCWDGMSNGSIFVSLCHDIVGPTMLVNLTPPLELKRDFIPIETSWPGVNCHHFISYERPSLQGKRQLHILFQNWLFITMAADLNVYCLLDFLLHMTILKGRFHSAWLYRVR